MATRMAPARGHDEVHELVDHTRRLPNILAQIVELTEINIQEIAGIDLSRNAVLDWNRKLRLIGAKDPVPDIQQVTEIGIHVQRVASMMYPMMRRGENPVTKKPETGIFQEVLPNVNEAAPGAVDKHDGKQHDRVHAEDNADAGTDKVRVGRFKNKVRIRYGKIHGLRRVMSGVQAPEEPDLVREKVIDEVREFPDDVADEKAVPRERNGKRRQRFKPADTEPDYSQRNESAQHPVEDIRQKRNAILRRVKLAVEKSHTHLNQDDERNQRRDGFCKTTPCLECTVVSGLNELDYATQGEKPHEFIPQKLRQPIHRFNIRLLPGEIPDRFGSLKMLYEIIPPLLCEVQLESTSVPMALAGEDQHVELLVGTLQHLRQFKGC